MQRLSCMIKRSSLVLLFAFAASLGHSVAEDLNSLDVIVRLTQDFKRFHQNKQKEKKTTARVIPIKPVHK